MNVCHLGVIEIARRVVAREVSPVEVVQAALERCSALDRDVQAWVAVDGVGALRAARATEARVARGEAVGPLGGVPVGIKDVFYTRGLATTASSKALSGHMTDTDAEAVARLRAAGAIILGKLETAEFAFADPPPTRNPWNFAHTPGGSSSGSAAAVASGMVPVALGTQTGGSTLRPAAYTGIVGYKPTYGLVSTRGTIPLSWSFDHVGILGRSVADVALVAACLLGRGEPDSERLAELQRSPGVMPAPPRLGLVSQFFLERSDEEVRAAMDSMVARLRAGGGEVKQVRLASRFAEIIPTMRAIGGPETAAYHRQRFAASLELYGPKIAAHIRAALELNAVDYVEASRARQGIADNVEGMLDGVGALLTPTAPAAAPRGLTTTGDASLCVPFSFAGLPSISLPIGLNREGLPLGAQLVGRRGDDDALLRVAGWCERSVGFDAHPAIW